MMGPASFTKKFAPGTMVKAAFGEQDYKIGTIIDNWVDIAIDSGYRTEKALVLWEEGAYEWISVGRLSILF